MSIITPAYNAEKTIENCINSVLNQTYTNWELIIIDDCSTDNTVAVVDRFLHMDKRIIFIKNNKNIGSGETRNKGIRMGKGRYIAFLDSDDIWFPQKLEIQLEFMRRNNLFFTYSSYYVKSNNNLFLFEVPQHIRFEDLLKTCWIGCLTVVYDKEMIGKYFMPTIKKAQDYVTWLNILKDHGAVSGIKMPLAQYNIHRRSNSYNKIRAIKYQWHVYRKYEGLSVFSSIYYIFFYSYFGLRKKTMEYKGLIHYENTKKNNLDF